MHSPNCQNQDLASGAVGQNQPKMRGVIFGESALASDWRRGMPRPRLTDPKPEAWWIGGGKTHAGLCLSLHSPAESGGLGMPSLRNGGFLLDVPSVRTYVNLWVFLLNMGTTILKALRNIWGFNMESYSKLFLQLILQHFTVDIIKITMRWHAVINEVQCSEFKQMCFRDCRSVDLLNWWDRTASVQVKVETFKKLRSRLMVPVITFLRQYAFLSWITIRNSFTAPAMLSYCIDTNREEMRLTS